MNINTAPRAVLYSLMDDRDVNRRFWDDIIYYRNQPEEEDDDPFADEPLIDFETGEEIITPMIFDSLDELSEIDDWEDFEPVVQAELENLLRVNSTVFSVYVTARVATGNQDGGGAWFEPQGAMGAREESRQGGLVRTVRAVLWRRAADDGEVEIVPLIPWELLDYVPFEITDNEDGGGGFPSL